MSKQRGGRISALAVAFPEEVRRNDWWSQHHPDLVAGAQKATLANVWADFAPDDASIYDQTLAPYLTDPFRGTVKRRVMGPNDSARSLSARACRRALAAGGYSGDDIDLVLVNALRPDAHVVGDAAWLMRDLGLSAPAINFESACSSALVGFQFACDLVASGRYRRILVVTCCTYTRDVDLADSFCWFLGDGAAAFVVEETTPASGLLGAKTIPTIETCGAFAYHLRMVDGAPALRIEANRKLAGQSIRAASHSYLRQCTNGALQAAGMQLEDVDFLIVNTPTAWYAEFCARTLGFSMDQVVDNYPEYANCGPALWPNNLHTALTEGRIRPGDVVLGYSVGSVSTASAVVFRAGTIATG